MQHSTQPLMIIASTKRRRTPDWKKRDWVEAALGSLRWLSLVWRLAVDVLPLLVPLGHLCMEHEGLSDVLHGSAHTWVLLILIPGAAHDGEAAMKRGAAYEGGKYNSA